MTKTRSTGKAQTSVKHYSTAIWRCYKVSLLSHRKCITEVKTEDSGEVAIGFCLNELQSLLLFRPNPKRLQNCAKIRSLLYEYLTEKRDRETAYSGKNTLLPSFGGNNKKDR